MYSSHFRISHLSFFIYFCIFICLFINLFTSWFCWGDFEPSRRRLPLAGRLPRRFCPAGLTVFLTCFGFRFCFCCFCNDCYYWLLLLLLLLLRLLLLLYYHSSLHNNFSAEVCVLPLTPHPSRSACNPHHFLLNFWNGNFTSFIFSVNFIGWSFRKRFLSPSRKCRFLCRFVLCPFVQRPSLVLALRL